MKNTEKLKKIIMIIIIAIIIFWIAIQFFISVNPIFYLFAVLFLFINRNKIREYVESKLDNRVSKTLKNNDYESVIDEEDKQEKEIEENQENNIDIDRNEDNTKELPLPSSAREISYEEVMKMIENEEQKVALLKESDSNSESGSDTVLTSEENQKKDLEISDLGENIELEKDNVQERVDSNNDMSDAIKKERDEDKPIIKTVANKYSLPKPYRDYLDADTSSMPNINKSAAAVKGERIIEILKQHKIQASLLNTYIGPRYTRFEFKPDSSVKLSRIKSLDNDIRLQLASKELFIEAPIPGRSSVGIDIPNVEPVTVRMINVIDKISSDQRNNKLLFPLGCNPIGNPVFCDLEKAIHLLIGGTTGSGKTMCLHSIIMSFLLRTKPNEVKLILIDPNKVEFSPYRDIPHLMWPIIDDSNLADNALSKLVVIVEERYELFATAGVRSIKSYNERVIQYNKNLKNGEKPMYELPYIVVIIDQYAELKDSIGDKLDNTIQRLTQLSRICGVHVIISTQRPSTDVVTGVIKSSFPSRISFALPAAIDSKTILNQSGAEYLLGEGDMMYHPVGQISPTRVQGIFVSDNEINRITKYVKLEAQPEYENSYYDILLSTKNYSVLGNINAKALDSLYDDVVEFVTSQQKASTSLLQMRFGIGYNRAARLIDTLEDKGIIGPANGAKPREVYRKPDNKY